jgi:outer membrane protein OmpA-like peptidoglycan-associated protein
MIALILALAVADGPRGELPEMDVVSLRPSVGSGPFIRVDHAQTQPFGTVTGRMHLNYAYGPLAYTYGDGTQDVLIDHVLAADVAGAVHFGRLRLGATVPIHLLATGAGLDKSTGGLGDVGLDGRLFLADAGPIGLATTGRLTLPTSTSGTPLGDGAVTGELAAVADVEAGPFTVAGNVGVRVRKSTELESSTVNDLWVGRFGVAWTPGDNNGLVAELNGHVAPRSSEGTAGEVLVSGWRRVAPAWVLRAGVGQGLTNAIGAPAFRMLVGVAVEPRTSSDSDDDGIADAIDRCPLEPEDIDRYQDLDGCADPDNDQDGIADTDDACPDEAEDLDGHEDSDGCAEVLNPLRVRFVDVQQRPVEGVRVSIGDEERTAGQLPAQWLVEPGSWTVQVEADGFAPLSAQVSVPVDAAAEAVFTLTRWDGMTGMMLQANDADGERVIGAQFSVDGQSWWLVLPGVTTALAPGPLTVRVRAPHYGEALLDVAIEEGRTSELFVTLAAPRVALEGQRIALSEEVFFETNRATIKSESQPMLDEVAALLLGNDDIAKVRIEGHADSRGDELRNLELSESRAKSVRTYLVGRGVAAQRLQAVGFGERQPLVEGDGPEVWDVNRRVDLFVVQWADTAP